MDATARLTLSLSTGLRKRLAQREQDTGESVDQLVEKALAEYLDDRPPTLYQASTSGALQHGATDGAIRVGAVRDLGNFGLGMFEHCEGEMVVVDGAVFQVRGDGSVRQSDDDDMLSAFVEITQFVPDTETLVERSGDLDALLSYFDPLRHSENIFYALRVDGDFESVRVGTRCATRSKTVMVREFHNVRGTLIGFWAPEYVQTLNVPGYHLHFLSSDRDHGGHLLACAGSNLRYQVQQLSDYHLTLPSTRRFLKAGL